MPDDEASCSQARSFSPTHAAIIAKYSDMVPADDCIFFHRKKLKCATAFAQRFLFPAEAGVDHTQHAPRRTEIWLRLARFSPAPRVQRQTPTALCARRLSCAR